MLPCIIILYIIILESNFSAPLYQCAFVVLILIFNLNNLLRLDLTIIISVRRCIDFPTSYDVHGPAIIMFYINNLITMWNKADINFLQRHVFKVFYRLLAHIRYSFVISRPLRHDKNNAEQQFSVNISLIQALRGR